MKAHIGVDADSGLVHTVRGTAGNVSDVVEANSLLRGQEIDGYGTRVTRAWKIARMPRAPSTGTWR